MVRGAPIACEPKVEFVFLAANSFDGTRRLGGDFALARFPLDGVAAGRLGAFCLPAAWHR